MVALLSQLHLPASPVVAFAAAGCALLLYAVLHDIAARTIPDLVSIVLALLGAGARLLDHRLPAGVGCGAAVFVAAAICWRRGWLGGGDVKLLGAAALLVPPALVGGFVVTVALAGGVLAMVYLALGRWLAPPTGLVRGTGLVRRVIRAERWRISRRGPLPYATAIATGAYLTLLVH